MKNETTIYLRFEKSLPKGTAQQKGECIKTKSYIDYSGKLRKRQYIHHFTKRAVSEARKEYQLKLKPYLPKKPSDKPIKLTIIFYSSIKAPRSAWGTYKTTRPDLDNMAKELIDAMIADKETKRGGFFLDDAQIVDLRLMKYYAEQATIYIRIEEVEP